MTNLSSSSSKSRRNQGKKPRAGSTSWPEVYRWVATGALVVYTAVGSRTITPALAQQQAAGGPSPDQAQTLVVRRFDISPGPLDSVLRAFENATELQFVVTNEAIRSVQSPGVSGLYTLEQGLQQILKDTGVTYRFSESQKVRLEFEAVSTTVEVIAQISQPSSPKYTEPLRDIPQTITVIPRTVIEQQGATSLVDVLRNVPGLTVSAGEGGAAPGDNLTLRGFSARNDIFIDGARDLGPQSRDPFNVEQVEVIKGPQSALTGRGSTGGAINMVSKSPGINRFFGGTLNFGTDPLTRATADVNVPFHDRAAFRLNLMGHNADVAGRNAVEQNRWGLAPSLAMGLGTPTRLTLGYFKLKQDNITDYGIPWVPADHNVLAEYRDKPAPVDRETFYGFKHRDNELMGADAATVRFEHDFGDNFTLRDQFRYGRSTRDSIATPPRFDSPDTTVIRREMRAWLTDDDIWDNQADLTARFSTGGIEHSVVTGFSLTREGNLRHYRSAPNSLTDLYNPNPNDIYTGEFTYNPLPSDYTGNSKAVYAFDTIRLGERWQVNGGLRSETYSVEGVTNTGAPVEKSDHMNSVRAGVVFKPAQNGSIYTSYGSSLNPSLEGLTYTGSGATDPTIDPEKTYTVEFGSKWDLFNRRVLLSGALFQVNKTNALTPGVLPDDPPQILDGKQRVRGVELGATGYVTSRWMVFGAYAYLDGKVVESNNPAEVGNEFPQTPDHAFSLWTTYEFPWRVTLGGGARYIGRRYNNTANVRFVDGYWTADLMASLPVTKHMDLRLNLLNLTNEYYFERLGGGHLIPGPSRTLMVSTRFHF